MASIFRRARRSPRTATGASTRRCRASSSPADRTISAIRSRSRALMTGEGFRCMVRFAARRSGGRRCRSRANRRDVLRKSRFRLPMAERRWCRGAGRSARMDQRYSLSDRVTNTGAKPFAPMLMYHMNMGGWMLGDDTHIAGTMFGNERRPWRFGDGESAHFCLPAAPTARDGWAQVALGPFEAVSGRSLIVRFSSGNPAVPPDVAMPARLGQRHQHRAGVAPDCQTDRSCRCG